MLSRNFHRHVVLPAFETVYKRRSTFKYWRELESSQWLAPHELADLQWSNLESLLDFAYAASPYYRQVFDEQGISPERIQSPSDLQKLPLLTKDEIRRHRLEMQARGMSQPLISKSTGGSTGEPLQFDLDQRSHERRCAATLRGYTWSGASPGTKQFYLWGVPLQQLTALQRWKEKFYERLQRRCVVNSFELSPATVPTILEKLNRYRPDVIVGYTNALYHFARELDDRGLSPWSPTSIVVGAEKLHSFQRETLERVFQAPVFETYGSREFMLIGAECPEHKGLHLTSEQLYVEILDDDGSPTAEGQIGNVVVTDLFNYGMPFIRYVTGDQAIAGFRQCTCGRGLPLLQEVRGRRLDVLTSPDGRQTPGEFFPHLIKDFSGVRKFQVVQRRLDCVELRVELTPNWSDEDRHQLLEQVQRQLGPEVDIHWQPCAQIKLTRTGKHRVVVNECASEPAEVSQPQPA